MPVALVKYEAARHALSEARRVDEVKDIRDKALAIAAYAKQANDTEMVEWATEIKVRAERRAGELLAAMDKAKGGQPYRSTRSATEQVEVAPTLGSLGIDRKQSARWQKLAAVPAAQFEKAVEAAKDVAREVTATFVLKVAEAERPQGSATAVKTPATDSRTTQRQFDDAGARWNLGLSNLWGELNSVHAAGGINRLSRRWSDAVRKSYLGQIDRLIERLTDIRRDIAEGVK